MNYSAHYARLIQRAKSRAKPEGYTEKQHIVPRCMDGGDDAENIAVLTAREHYVAHQLLVKIHPSEFKLTVAAILISQVGKHNSRMYAWLRNRIVNELTGKATPMNTAECVVKRERTKREKSDEEKRIVGERISAGIKAHLKNVPGGYYAENIKRALASQTHEQLSANAKKARYRETWRYRGEQERLAQKERARQRGRDVNKFRTTEQRIADATKIWTSRTPEQRAEIGRKISEAKKRNNELRKIQNAE